MVKELVTSLLIIVNWFKIKDVFTLQKKKRYFGITEKVGSLLH